MSDGRKKAGPSSRHPTNMDVLPSVRIPRRTAEETAKDAVVGEPRRPRTRRGEEVPQSSVSIEIPTHLHADQRKPAREVTIDDPYRSNYSKNKLYAHTNSQGDHRYHRETQGEAARSRTPISVEEYIKLCAADNVRDGKRFQAISNMPVTSRNAQGQTVNGEPKRTKSWRTQWRHMGARALNCKAVQPCDFIWLRCPEEKEYQERLVESNTVMTGRTEPYKTFHEIPSCLPRPITEWYMFCDAMYWDDDIIYEDRMRTKNFNPCTDPGAEFIGLMISWHWINLHDVPINQRYKLFYRTPESIREIELSPVVPTPTSPAAIYAEHLSTWNYDVQDMFVARVLREQVEINFSFFVKAASDGVKVSRLDDPRITASGKYGVLIPIPNKLFSRASNDMVADLFYESGYDMDRIRMAVDRSGLVDWKELAKKMKYPFAWYDFANSKVIDLPRREEIEYHIVGEKVLSWCVRVYPEIRIPFLPPTERQPISYEFAQEEIRTGMRNIGLLKDDKNDEVSADRPDEDMEIDDEGDVRDRERMEEMRQDLVDDRHGIYQQVGEVFGFFHSHGNVVLPENLDDMLKDYAEMKRKNQEAESDGPKLVSLRDNVKKLEQDKDILKGEVDRISQEKDTLKKDVERLQHELAESRSETARLTVQSNALRKHAAALNEVVELGSRTIFNITGTTESEARQLADNMKNMREQHQLVLKNKLGRVVQVTSQTTRTTAEGEVNAVRQVVTGSMRPADMTANVPTGVPFAIVRTDGDGSNPTTVGVGQVQETTTTGTVPPNENTNPSRSTARRNIAPTRRNADNRGGRGTGDNV